MEPNTKAKVKSGHQSLTKFLLNGRLRRRRRSHPRRGR